jgi:YHS domain-containing protein
MTAFRSRSALAVCSLMGTAVTVSLAGYVWAQQPAENWPFEEHNQAPAPATQPTTPPPQKSVVQQRLEELYRRDNRPLPDYMRQDASSDQAAPAQAGGYPTAGDVGSMRTQREASPPAQGTVHQQLSDYYQSQGKSMPVPQRAGGSSSTGSTQNSPYQSGTASQPGQATAAQPAQGHWYDRINPFHKSTPPAQPQSQVQSSATVSTAASDADHSAPAPQGFARVTSPTAPVQGSPAVLTVQEASSPESAPSAASKSFAATDAPAPVAAPVAKSGSFWGDLSLRRAPSQPAASPFPTPIVVDLGPGAHLVRKSQSPASAHPDAAAPVVAAHPAPSKVKLAVVDPGAIVSSAEPPVAPAAPKVAAANAVADEPAMPFLSSSEADADQKTSSGPYTGLTLEDEQSQLTPPTPEAKRTATSSATHAPATAAADTHHADSAKNASPAPQSKESLPADSHEIADHNPAAKPTHGASAHSVATDHEPTSSAALQQQASDEHSEPSGHKTISDAPVADEQPAVTPRPSAAPNHVADQRPAAEQHVAAEHHAAGEQQAATEHPTASAHPHHLQTAREKARLIEERAGQRGLKGFCPVVLRDQRELADVNLAYCSIYHGRKYYFSSAAAEARFEACPHKYAPIAGGVDVVVKTNSDQDVEGSLDFALWYKDRLYLFCSPESLQAFSLSPTAYSAAAQRIE